MLIPLRMTSDARIVGRVLGGRRDEFGVLVDRYYRAVESVARARLENSVDAEDVAQEAFVSAYRKLDTLMDPQKFGPWVMAIARNAAVSWIRRRKSEVLVADVATVAEPREDPPVERAELQRIVRAKLQDMEPEQREILLLFYYGGKTVGEVASLLEITKAAAHKRLQRAREALGSEFLKSIGESRKATDRSADGKRAKRTVMAAIASAPVVWEARAAAGSAWLAVVKVLIGALAVVAIGVGVTIGVKYAQSEPAEPVAATAQQTEPVTQPATATAPVEAVEPAMAEEQEEELTGPGRIEVILLDGETQQPVGSADVAAELLTWGPRDMPPEKTFRKKGQADGQGRLVLEDLPVGTYCVIATTATMCGVNDDWVRPEAPTSTLRLWMRARVSAAGVLTGPNGAPVAGAVIYPVRHILMPNDVFGHTEVAAVRAVTGADGRFSFPFIFPGAWQFYILSPNLPPAITDYKMLEGELVLKLEAAGSIPGRVLDAASGEGRDRVVVRAFQGNRDFLGNPSLKPKRPDEKQYGWRVAVEAESGPDGSFRLANVAPGKYKIETGDAVLLNISPDVEFEVKPGAETTAEVKVAVGASILGRVYNRDTGEGLAGMDVYGPSGPAITTDANGEYMLTGLVPGSHSLRVRFPTGEEGRVPLFGEAGRMETTATVTFGQVVEHVDFAVKPAAVVKGRVVDRAGTPVAGATVHVTAMNVGNERKTGADGTFSFFLFSADNLRVVGKKDAWQSEVVKGPDASQEILLTLNVPANGAIYGTALSAEGKPLVLYSVSASVLDETLESGTRWTCASANTGPSGEFALENLAAGSYEVCANQYGPGRDFYVTQNVRLAQNQVIKNLVLRPEVQGGLSISGRIVLSEGGEFMGARVGIPWGQLTGVERDGRFVLRGLKEGSYTLIASCAGYSPVAVGNVEAGTQNLTVKLVRPAVFAGNVTDARTGKPVTVFQLNAWTEPQVQSETIQTYVINTFSNEQGRFELKNFAAMRVQLKIGAQGYATWKQQVELKEGPNEIAVQLEPGSVVRGTVTDSQGNPVAGAEILLGPTNARPIMEQCLARTNETGSFETNTLAEGVSLRLVAKHPAYAPDCVDVTPTRANPTEATFTLQPAGELEVHVLLDGEPTGRCHVGIEGDCLGRPYYSGEPTGLVIQNLPSGEVEFTAVVYVENGENPHQQVTATVEPGQTTLVEVNFESQKSDAPAQ
ncbi:MAG TPA: sigma-70 family RNA polymerase sigma factor [Candidatus Bathyarchaeia archaeon]|nr:sigma-70 family RNA polymerase sigma factor [Candidatus Bathyarchaeia archaeon]